MLQSTVIVSVVSYTCGVMWVRL